MLQTISRSFFLFHYFHFSVYVYLDVCLNSYRLTSTGFDLNLLVQSASNQVRFTVNLRPWKNCYSNWAARISAASTLTHLTSSILQLFWQITKEKISNDECLTGPVGFYPTSIACLMATAPQNYLTSVLSYYIIMCIWVPDAMWKFLLAMTIYFYSP